MNGRGEITKRSYEMVLTWKKKTTLMTDGRKGINVRRLEWQRQLEEGNNIIVKWAQEAVETLYCTTCYIYLKKRKKEN